MKKYFFFILIIGFAQVLLGQTVVDIKHMIRCNRFQSAKEIAQDILKQDSANAEAWLLLTRIDLHQKEDTLAERSLNSVPASLRSSASISCAYGTILLHRGKKDSANIYFNEALKQSRQSDPAILYAIAVAETESGAGDVSYAVELLNKAIRRDKNNADLYIAQGNAYRKLQNGSECYRAYNTALAKDEHNAEALYKLGTIFVSQNNPEAYLNYFKRAVAADIGFAPAWYALYYYYYFREPEKSMNCLQHYMAVSDPDPDNNYRYTDLLYLSKDYKAAIQQAKQLLDRAGSNSDARLYKLIAYSYHELNDSLEALDNMRKYFNTAPDSVFIMKDFETMAELYEQFPDKSDSAAAFLARAVTFEKDDGKRLVCYRKIGKLYKNVKDYNNQAIWLGRYYESNQRATNLDLFDWALSYYMAGNYKKADTVFALYTTKYPGQTFGYYWRARCNGAIDSTMEKGLAIPHYNKLIEVAASDSSDKLSKKRLIEAYGYIAAYRANTLKDYTGAIDYFEKLLALDPSNAEARKYVDIIKKSLAKKGEALKSSK